MEATLCSVRPETIAQSALDSDHAPSHSSPSPPQPLSKSALKKVAKAERYAAYKIERRTREKEAKKEKKRQKAAKRAAGELGEDEEEENKRRTKKPRVGRGNKFRGKVVVDLGFDDMMTEKVCTSGDFIQLNYFFILIHRVSGSDITMFPTGIHIQCQSSRVLSFYPFLYFAQWTHVHATGRHE